LGQPILDNWSSHQGTTCSLSLDRLMTTSNSVNATLVLREVEGYLELITVLADRFELDVKARDLVAQRVLACLKQVPPGDEYHVERLYYRGEALRVMERYEEALLSLQGAAEDHPGPVHIWLAIGWCEKRLGRIEMAIAALEQATAVDPENALVHYNLACYWSLAGDVDLALQELSSASRMDPHYLQLASEETDFDPIRDDPRLELMLSQSLAP
jgi:tetratricopeptide (TPR) repeat protein